MNDKDPSPKLKSSPIPILFISFNEKDNNCLNCEGEYIWTPFCSQKYCKKCFSLYITDINNNSDVYLDVYLLGCNKHKIIGITNIEECCRNCLKILYFKQIPASYFCYNASDYGSYNVIEREKYCKLCEKSLYQGTNHNIAKEFKLCSNCYLISSGWIESTLTKNPIPIIYLPWWNNISYCETCYSKLIFTSECQKHLCDPIYQNYRYSCNKAENLLEWIPYSQFTDVKEIARGGFGIIYQATWLNDPIYDDSNIYSMKRNKENRRNESVILKRFKSSENLSKYFLNELKSNYYCSKINHHIIRTYGITWNNKLQTLWQISEGLETIHNAEFIHRDFHSGNILLTSSYYLHRWQIGDLGLSQPANNTSSNNEIYGVIPYVAPEIFKGSAFSKESDIYSMGMIMWEFTTGCKPFANVEHDIRLIYKILDGLRPKITEDTPECYANLMKSCWDSDPQKRPSIAEICQIFRDRYFGGNGVQSTVFACKNSKNVVCDFGQAEEKRIELINSQKFGPEFVERTHSKAIY
ncbi:kinase-like protein [Rhizophagus irregularis]|uniref:Kinase-like protein n=1 Tax=Rhizophagus irregularis TaxID=588596 RepID=A0A2N0PRV6_9GLOM|nr:kinase-like protein [Rhizophagus irregularis]